MNAPEHCSVASELITPPSRSFVGFRWESEMTAPAIAASDKWWRARKPATFVATEVVGPDAIADLVAVRFTPGSLEERTRAGIRPVIDRLALLAVLQSQRRARTTSELATLCRVGLSGMRRALAIGVNAGALVRDGRHVATNPAWSPVADRVVAVELKLDNALAALDQARAYRRWANAAWMVLARAPSPSAITAAQSLGVGVATLDADGSRATLVPPRTRRRPTCRWAGVWAAEQALACAYGAGLRASSVADPHVIADSAKPTDASAALLL